MAPRSGVIIRVFPAFLQGNHEVKTVTNAAVSPNGGLCFG
jgi:hypothetical protein